MPRKKSAVPSAKGASRNVEPDQRLPPADGPDTISQIRQWHRKRVYIMEARKRLDLALGAYVRTALGWRKDLPEAERKRISVRAAKVIKSGGDAELSDIIAANAMMRDPLAKIEAKALREMSKLAESLPVWAAFGQDIRGFGAASLAVIVAEAGDLSLYANPGKLWKRMGLAVMGDVRQGGLSKTAGADAWIAHGYNRQRRSRMWNIGDALIKGNKGEFREIYLARKAYEVARDPEIKPIKAHRRAQRYMEKRLLRNLWRAWRRAERELVTFERLPAAPDSSAKERLPPQGAVPSERRAVAGATSKGASPAASLSAHEAEPPARITTPPRHGVPAATHPEPVA